VYLKVRIVEKTQIFYVVGNVEGGLNQIYRPLNNLNTNNIFDQLADWLTEVFRSPRVDSVCSRFD
jgi:hypothetical protein